MFLVSNLNFEKHLKPIFNKVNKTTSVIRKFHKFSPRKSLLTIHKSFIRPHLDYSDIIYDQSYNGSFHQRLESLKYNTALAITGIIRGTLKENFILGLEKLGLESLQNRRRYRKLFFLYRFITNQSPSYLLNVIPKNNTTHST